MSQSHAIVDRYLHLMQEMLINSIYQDRAIDPWSHPTFDVQKRDGGLDWPRQAMTMIGAFGCDRYAKAARVSCERVRLV